MRSAARLAIMMDLAATVLCCTPTYAMHLAEVAREEGIDLSRSRLRTILVGGEPGGSIPATRARIESLWPGARVVDHHGMTEIGPVSYECPVRRGVLHVIESAFIPEVIDQATSQPVAQGGAGELVLTNLGRAGSPLLRYRTGDIVQRASADRCECGSYEMALEGGILGRTDDMVVVRGVNVYPSAVEEILRSCAGVAEYRVRISESRSMVELALEAEPDAAHENDPALAHHLETAFRDALALRIPVMVVPRGTLPRFEMKARRWVKE
jgi:phenylacetate-CoA ligase